ARRALQRAAPRGRFFASSARKRLLTQNTMRCIILFKGEDCMDAQLKRGMLEACVLAVLARGDSYGYRLVKEVGACVEISESTLYPILRRLEASGSLRVYARAYNGR